MKITMHEIPIRELVKNYTDNNEEGVYGYDNKLNIRPKYQREFIYNDAQRKAVIDTVTKNFPLNVMYWVVNEDHNYEVLDGQQRTISICQYVHGDYSVNDKNGNPKYFHNLSESEKDEILNYKLMVYFCEGTDEEKLDWFTTINIAGVFLTKQELRNAVYTGEWLTHAKSLFSKSNAPAYRLAKDYVSGSLKLNRQDYLELALSWGSKGSIEEYMATHQFDNNADELWNYFLNVIDWVEETFIVKRDAMKGVNWGELYDKYSQNTYNQKELEIRISELMSDDEITAKKGIYDYIFSGNENKLSLRKFDKKIKTTVYEMQKGICVKCEKHFEYDEMEGDHIIAWSQGGKTTLDNLQMLCKRCNNTKSNA